MMDRQPYYERVAYNEGQGREEFDCEADVLDASGLFERVEELEARPCPHVVTGDEGTSYCALADDAVSRLVQQRDVLDRLVARLWAAQGRASRVDYEALHAEQQVELDRILFGEPA